MWVPWALWQAYGNLQVLSDQYDSMTAHVRRVESLLSPTGLWDTGFQFGDWLDPTAPPDEPISSESGQRRRGDRLPLPRRPNSYRDRRACLDAARMPRISQSSQSARKLPSTTIT